MKSCEKQARRRRSQFGGVDLIQLITALLIIGIAAASATFSMYIGRGNLNHEWRKKRALELARNEIEYWTALTYQGQGGEGIPITLRDQTLVYEEVLDPRGPTNFDDIKCRVQREPVILKIILAGGADIETYLIKVNIIWDEPTTDISQPAYTDTVSLHTYMIYSSSISGGTSQAPPPPGS